MRLTAQNELAFSGHEALPRSSRIDRDAMVSMAGSSADPKRE
jgi:hypothetical protein